MKLAELEIIVDECISQLAPFTDGTVRDVIAGSTDLSQKSMILKGLVFHRIKTPERRNQISDAIAKIRSLQDRRNRFVHDVWPVGEPVTRWRRRVSVSKSQSFQEPKLTTDEKVPVDLEELWDLVSDINDTGCTLSDLMFEVISQKLQKQSSPPSPKAP